MYLQASGETITLPDRIILPKRKTISGKYHPQEMFLTVRNRNLIKSAAVLKDTKNFCMIRFETAANSEYLGSAPIVMKRQPRSFITASGNIEVIAYEDHCNQ